VVRVVKEKDIKGWARVPALDRKKRRVVDKQASLSEKAGKFNKTPINERQTQLEREHAKNKALQELLDKTRQVKLI
jgi:N12 class adenine-specific DNA methylase